ncbi:uncharacterized protein LOC129264278 [Lytechinus pictus]|uniref:uncharacterized protein LOC129264278 n=1 Tax=Lytechinus pictus TaxID=7653 RepID=UPI0030BA25A1
MTTENIRNAEPVVGDETPENNPSRWATPKSILRKQATRLTIIEEPTDIVSIDDNHDNESTASTSESNCFACSCSWTDLDSIQKRFLIQGVMVRVILLAHSFFIFYAALAHVHVAAYICICIVYAAISTTEGIIMYKIRGFSQKKWICTSTALYTMSVIPAIWTIHITMLNKREREGYDACLQNYSACYSHPVYDQQIHNDTTMPFVAKTYREYERLTTVVEYSVVFVLIFCRWLLPRDNFTREKVAQLLLVLVGAGEDIVEFVAVIITNGHFGCSRAITTIVLLLWSIAVFQFSIAIPEKRNRVHDEKRENAILNVWVDAVNQLLSKRRETVGDVSLYVAKKEARPLSRMMQRRRTAPNIRQNDWVQSTEFREAIISITIQDGPFLVFRLIIIAILGDEASSVYFYALKNLTVILLQIYRVYAMLVESRQRKRGSLFVANNTDGNDVENNNIEMVDGTSLVSESLTMNEKAFTYAVDEEMKRKFGDDSSSQADVPAENQKSDGDNLNGSPVRAPNRVPMSSEADIRIRRQSILSK